MYSAVARATRIESQQMTWKKKHGENGRICFHLTINLTNQLLNVMCIPVSFVN